MAKTRMAIKVSEVEESRTSRLGGYMLLNNRLSPCRKELVTRRPFLERELPPMSVPAAVWSASGLLKVSISQYSGSQNVRHSDAPSILP